MTLSRLIARPMLASMFVVGGANSLKAASGKADAAEPVTDHVVAFVRKIAPQVPIPSDPATLVRVNGAVQILAGLALATGRAPRLSAAVLAAQPGADDRGRPPVLAGAGPCHAGQPSGSTSSRMSRCSVAC